MRYFLFVLAMAIVMLACQKEINFGAGSGTNNPPASTVRCTGCSYLPVCDSTKLTYIDSTAAGLDTTESILMILGDTTINGRKFNRITPSSVFPQGLLYNCDGGDYRIYQPVPDLGIDIDSILQALGLPGGAVTIPSRIQTTILKSNASAGSTWSDTVFQFAPIPLFTVVARLDYKLEAKGVQRVVLGKTFNNVIHVSSKLNIVIPLMPSPVDLKIDYYFANDIGIVETKTTNAGVIEAQTKLYQYKIK